MNTITYILMALAAVAAVPMSPEAHLAKLEENGKMLDRLEQLEQRMLDLGVNEEAVDDHAVDDQAVDDQGVKEEVCDKVRLNTRPAAECGKAAQRPVACCDVEGTLAVKATDVSRVSLCV